MSSLDDLQRMRGQIEHVRKSLHAMDETMMHSMIDLWCSLNESTTQQLLDLALRVQHLEDKLKVKQKVRISKG